jgi:hypothetical protein
VAWRLPPLLVEVATGDKETPMGEPNLVVVRYLNGTTVKGTTQDFYPDKPMFHVQERGGAKTASIKMADLKAVFFVKDLVGDANHEYSRTFTPLDPGLAQGKRVAILFKDGELLLGYTLSYTLGRTGLWVIPVDQAGNNIRVFVLSAAAKQIKLGPAADALALSAPKVPPKLKKTA